MARTITFFDHPTADGPARFVARASLAPDGSAQLDEGFDSVWRNEFMQHGIREYGHDDVVMVPMRDGARFLDNLKRNYQGSQVSVVESDQ
jgi:hypothetical protein